MAELLRTNDVALISVVEALLGEGGIPFHVADSNISVIEGTINMFPRRILVADGREDEARQLLVAAGRGGGPEGPPSRAARAAAARSTCGPTPASSRPESSVT